MGVEYTRHQEDLIRNMPFTLSLSGVLDEGSIHFSCNPSCDPREFCYQELWRNNQMSHTLMHVEANHLSQRQWQQMLNLLKPKLPWLMTLMAMNS